MALEDLTDVELMDELSKRAITDVLCPDCIALAVAKAARPSRSILTLIPRWSE